MTEMNYQISLRTKYTIGTSKAQNIKESVTSLEIKKDITSELESRIIKNQSTNLDKCISYPDITYHKFEI